MELSEEKMSIALELTANEFEDLKRQEEAWHSKMKTDLQARGFSEEESSIAISLVGHGLGKLIAATFAERWREQCTCRSCEERRATAATRRAARRFDA